MAVDTHARTAVKGLSWRALGTMCTVILGVFFTVRERLHLALYQVYC